MTTTMSSPTSSLSSLTSSPTSKTLSAHLDSQIARLNAQIASLRQEKQSLSSALLASSTVQSIVQSRKSTRPDNGESEKDNTYRRLEEAVTKQQARNDIKVHRLMNNVTSFPFTDPAPDRVRRGEDKMLGLRFEMPCTPLSDSPAHGNDIDGRSTGVEIEKIFLVVLGRIQRGGKTYLRFQPEMNQIPKHIDVEGFAAQYLPVPDTNNDHNRRSPCAQESESFQDDSGIDVTQDLTNIVNGTNAPHATSTTNPPDINTPRTDISNTDQSLPLFVSTTRDALLSWHYRKSYIHFLINNLTISSSPPEYLHAITAIRADPAALKLTIDWENGTTAVLGINEKGYVGIARVFGPRIGYEDEEVDGDGNGTFRCHGVERRLEGVRLAGLAGRLEEIGRLMDGSGFG